MPAVGKEGREPEADLASRRVGRNHLGRFAAIPPDAVDRPGEPRCEDDRAVPVPGAPASVGRRANPLRRPSIHRDLPQVHRRRRTRRSGCPATRTAERRSPCRRAVRSSAYPAVGIQSRIVPEASATVRTNRVPSGEITPAEPSATTVPFSGALIPKRRSSGPTAGIARPSDENGDHERSDERDHCESQPRRSRKRLRDAAGAAAVRLAAPGAPRASARFVRDVAGALPALAWVFRQAPGDDVFEGGRRKGLNARKRGRVAVHDGGDERRLAVAVERAPAGRHLVEQAAQRPQVGSRVGLAALRAARAPCTGTCRRLIPRRSAARRPSARAPSSRCRCRARAEAGRARQAEVHELGAGLREHDVAGLEVAVDHAGAVRAIERVGDLRASRSTSARERARAPGAPPASRPRSARAPGSRCRPRARRRAACRCADG